MNSSDPSTSSVVIDRLVSDLRPRSWLVRWFVKRRVRIIAWSAIATMFTIIGMYFCPGPPVRTMLSTSFILQTGAIFGLGVLLGVVAILLSVPGERVPPWIWRSATGMGVVSVAAIVFLDPELGWSWAELVGHSDELLVCSHAIVLWAIVPAVAGLFLVHLGAPLRGSLASTFICLAAGLLATTILQVECTDRSALHVLVGHVAPAVGLGFMACGIAALVAVWRARLRDLRIRLNLPGPRN